MIIPAGIVPPSPPPTPPPTYRAARAMAQVTPDHRDTEVAERMAAREAQIEACCTGLWAWLRRAVGR